MRDKMLTPIPDIDLTSKTEHAGEVCKGDEIKNILHSLAPEELTIENTHKLLCSCGFIMAKSEVIRLLKRENLL